MWLREDTSNGMATWFCSSYHWLVHRQQGVVIIGHVWPYSFTAVVARYVNGLLCGELFSRIGCGQTVHDMFVCCCFPFLLLCVYMHALADSTIRMTVLWSPALLSKNLRRQEGICEGGGDEMLLLTYLFLTMGCLLYITRASLRWSFLYSLWHLLVQALLENVIQPCVSRCALSSLFIQLHPVSVHVASNIRVQCGLIYKLIMTAEPVWCVRYHRIIDDRQTKQLLRTGIINQWVGGLMTVSISELLWVLSTRGSCCTISQQAGHGWLALVAVACAVHVLVVQRRRKTCRERLLTRARERGKRALASQLPSKPDSPPDIIEVYCSIVCPVNPFLLPGVISPLLYLYLCACPVPVYVCLSCTCMYICVPVTCQKSCCCVCVCVFVCVCVCVCVFRAVNTTNKL